MEDSVTTAARRSRLRAGVRGLVAAAGAALLVGVAATPSSAAFTIVSGAGSTWASNAVQQWAADLAVAAPGLTLTYQANGSTAGRTLMRNGVTDFAVTEQPYGITDPVGLPTDVPPVFPHVYVPAVAGSLGLMYNLSVSGTRITDLRLSPSTVAGLFTGAITSWDDPAVAADNPGRALPAVPVVPVVRSDGSGTTLHFTGWLQHVAPARWDAYCAAAGRASCAPTAFFPVLAGGRTVAQNGSIGVSGYVASATGAGTITYVESVYALNARFPQVKLLNAGDRYVAPTAGAVGLALRGARADVDPETPGFPGSVFAGAWDDADPRAYPLSYFAYGVTHADLASPFTLRKGQSVAEAFRYGVCEGQQKAEGLGYGLLPAEATTIALGRLAAIPGADPATLGIVGCANPAVTPDGQDALGTLVQQPPACDALGATVCGAPTPTPTPSPNPTPTPTPTPTSRCRDDGHRGHGHGRGAAQEDRDCDGDGDASEDHDSHQADHQRGRDDRPPGRQSGRGR